jgi:hypothetical protein
MAKDANGNEITGSEPTPGQDSPTPSTEELQKQMADLIAANKKQSADLELLREENQRVTQMMESLRTHSGDDPHNPRREPPKGSGRFKDPAYRSEFERQYSLPVEAAEVIIEESVSRMSQAQMEREEAIRNGEALKKDFFEKYPDLADYLPIVRYFADKCAMEHPNWTAEKGFVEVSKLAREYIKSKLGTPSGREEPPPVIASGGSRSGGAPLLPGSTAPEGPAVMPTQDEELRAEMAERNKNRARAL